MSRATSFPCFRRHAPQARVLFDTVDLHYLREQRAAEIMDDDGTWHAVLPGPASSNSTSSRASTRRSWCRRLERELLSRDAPACARRGPFQPASGFAGPGLPFAQRRDLVFVGGFRHPPNVDAVSLVRR
jgi:O-antigen biosynthesis protein